MDEPDITIRRKFIDIPECKIILSLFQKINFVHTYHHLYGEYRKSKVGYVWISETGLSYTFSKNMKKALPAHSFEEFPFLECIKDYVEGIIQMTFNSVLVNRYIDGETSLSYHHDDDAWLGKNFVVVSLSFGDKRRFLVKQKEAYLPQNKVPVVKEYILGNGDLLIMGESVQKYWVHSIPVQKKSLDDKQKNTGMRYNLTFRNVHPELFSKMPKPKELH